MPKVQMHVFANAKDGKDDEFNRWYDKIHLSEVIQLTEAIAASRYQLSDHQAADAGGFRYLAIYEFEVGAKEAFGSLIAATKKMDMGDSLGDTKIVFFDEITERVTS
jgi:hypothetical protein